MTEPRPKKPLALALATVLVLIAAALLYLHLQRLGWLRERSDQLERLVAVSWGDGKYGRALYGAYVYYEPRADGQVEVKLSVRIARGGPDGAYAHATRTLGTAKDDQDAVARWGAITWTAQGLQVGSGSAAHVFARSELESHR